MFVNSVTLHRLLQSINWHGSTYDFTRYTLNEYKEKSNEPVKIATVKGLYHNGSSNHTAIRTSDAGMVIDKSAPYILMSWEDAKNLVQEDMVKINDKTFKVTDTNNINELNIVGEVSLEVML